MSEKSSSKRRVAGSYFMSMMSIALVLFLLGVFALFMMQAQTLSNYLKENIGFEVMMNSKVDETDIKQLQEELKAMPAVKSAEYISKNEAIHRLSEDLGQDFLQWLGDEENPLLPSIDVRFNAAWANNDSIIGIKAQLLKNPNVEEISYHKPLVDLVNQNVRRIGIGLLIASAILLFIAIALIRNTLRLSIYAKRFLVRSMLLVGATASYIRRPFIKSGISQGFFGALLADVLLALLIYGVSEWLQEPAPIQDNIIIICIFVGIIVLGILLGGLSTRSAIRKYLRANVDQLYA